MSESGEINEPMSGGDTLDTDIDRLGFRVGFLVRVFLRAYDGPYPVVAIDAVADALAAIGALDAYRDGRDGTLPRTLLDEETNTALADP